MPANIFNVQAGDATIGTVDLSLWDDGMAVAGGIFRPGSDYEPQQHATELDGIKINQPTVLSLSFADGRLLDCELVTIIDWTREAGDEGREIVAYGVTDCSFMVGS